jgi:hypothetical protein
MILTVAVGSRSFESLQPRVLKVQDAVKGVAVDAVKKTKRGTRE